MQITLPKLIEKIIDTTVVIGDKETSKKEYCSEIVREPFNLDMSINAEMRWERNFPNTYRRKCGTDEIEESLWDYTNRIATSSEEEVALHVKIRSYIKALYCWFDTTKTFEEFQAMFCFTNISFLRQLCSEFEEVINIIASNAVEKN